MHIHGVAAIVSGGASGLGEAVARRLVAEGAVCTILDRNIERGTALAAALGGHGRFVECDIADPDSVSAAFDDAGTKAPLRIAVNCAGIGSATRLVNRHGQPHDFATFAEVISVNLLGTFNCMRLAAAAMSRQAPLDNGERGVVINTASIAAFEGQIGQLAYAAAKAGIVGMTLPAARDLSETGIRVMTIAPGTFDTPLLGSLSPELRRTLDDAVPFPRVAGAPDQFADLVTHICTNQYLNGETIRLDGALRLAPK